ncbi:FG-GAP repeat protein [Microbulbifer sp. ANSA003]|uniref:FG-GAP repeat protein n=1 Tax=Microbulbifer sp. ANSA003 TaxID=3243360 RepID=UPI004042A93E
MLTRGYFGHSISLSNDGSRLTIGAHEENSSSTGTNRNQRNSCFIFFSFGAVYLYTRTTNLWTQQVYIKSSNSDLDDAFGYSVSLSGDGKTLAVGAHNEDSSSTGINGDQTNNDYFGSGTVYVFTRSENTWNQQSYLKASNGDKYDLFGSFIHLSSDASTLALGAIGERNFATGVNDDQANNNASDYTGAVYLYTGK